MRYGKAGKNRQTSGVSGKGTGAGRKVSIFGRVFAVSACVMAMTFAGTMYAAGMEERDFSGIDVTIRTFYTDHNLKYGVCPDSSYTAHPIQVFLTEKIPDGLLSDTAVMTLNGFNYITRMLGPAVMPWIEIRGSRAGTLEIKSPQTGFGIVRKETGITGYTVMRYSYFSRRKLCAVTKTRMSIMSPSSMRWRNGRSTCSRDKDTRTVFA